MSRLLALTAVEAEARGLARHLGLAPVPGQGWARFGGGALEVACVGLRAARLAERGATWPNPAMVVSAGLCGALAPRLAVGELVVPEEVVEAGGRRWPTAPLAGLARAGAVLCVSEVVETAAAKAR
ncbi:MAG TPA: hypothetical protein VLI67_12005, partial [Vicinamibacteria bacterium]|nr:hypothetical protein [Vicinamibacteria bacterium]